MKKHQLTGTGRTIVSTASEDDVKLDHSVKKLIACKPILARIIKGTVEEFKEITPEEIETYIEGEVLVERALMEPGLSNITGLSTEDFQEGEGMIIYDIRTYLRLPMGGEQIKIFLNVEAQKEENPGYDIQTRAIFHCCRMLSSQLGTEFTVQSDDPKKYANIKKVYSIFLCTAVADKRANSIERYQITKDFLYGQNVDTPRYDIMQAVIVNISKRSNVQNIDNDLLLVLTDLLNNQLSTEEKLKRMNGYGIPVTEEIKQEVDHMSGYAAYIREQGIEQGQIGLVIHMLNNHKTPEDIAEFCDLELAYVKGIEQSIREDSERSIGKKEQKCEFRRF